MTNVYLRTMVPCGLWALLLSVSPASAHPLFDAHSFAATDLPPSVAGGAVGALSNPASWATTSASETAFWWSDRDLAGGPRNWGLSTGRELGYAVQRSVRGPARHYDHHVGVSGGDGRGHVGLGYQFTSGDDAGRESAITLGWIHRPSRRVSWGAGFAQSTSSGARTGLLDFGVRPLPSPLVTLYGAYALTDEERADDGRWKAGVSLRPMAGVDLGATVRRDGDDVALGVHVGLTLDGLGAHVTSRYNEDGDRTATHSLVRLNPPQSGLPVGRALRSWREPNRIVPIRLENRSVTYQPDRYFDEGRLALLDLLRGLDAIANEPSVAGVAVDLSGFRVSTASAWELRQAMSALRANGKSVFVHADRLSMVGYYLASESDYLQLDPEGGLRLAGLSATRTYFGDALEKIGIGFESFRYFTHKSALESYTRRDMSDADREQLGRLIDQRYEWIRSAVTQSRDLPVDAFDSAVDELAVVTSSSAVDRGLADGLGRWRDVESEIDRTTGLSLRSMPNDRSRRWHPDDEWGAPPRIIVAYAVGPCEMDSGIRGRSTSKAIARFASASDVRGLVLRADSPGGDPLPSDLVAAAASEFRDGGKPMVVSQGNVAASGGYWLSVPGRPLITTPFTVTGSIGVIGGWAWDDGLGERLGISADGVSRGAHADLLGGLRFPVIGAVLPTRPFRDDERAIVRERFAELYTRFVDHVAEGRELAPGRVRELGEGRVWTGEDAVANGLADRTGTLLDAIEIAEEQAGLSDAPYVRIDEYPPRRFWNLSRFIPRPLSMVAVPRGIDWPWETHPSTTGEVAVDALDWPDEIRLMIEHPGDPMVIVPETFVLD